MKRISPLLALALLLPSLPAAAQTRAPAFHIGDYDKTQIVRYCRAGGWGRDIDPGICGCVVNFLAENLEPEVRPMGFRILLALAHNGNDQARVVQEVGQPAAVIRQFNMEKMMPATVMAVASCQPNESMEGNNPATLDGAGDSTR
jgi:hypothetical protein